MSAKPTKRLPLVGEFVRGIGTLVAIEEDRDIKPEIQPEELGKLVRETWIQWARARPECKPNWITPWDELPEPLRQVDRLIGVAVRNRTLGYTPSQDFIFKEFSASSELRKGEHVLVSFTTYNDHHGLETCVVQALKHAARVMSKYGVTAESELHVVVVKFTDHCRCIPRYQEENFYSKEFVNFERKRNTSHHGVPAKTEEVVWDSRQAAT